MIPKKGGRKRSKKGGDYVNCPVCGTRYDPDQGRCPACYLRKVNKQKKYEACEWEDYEIDVPV